MILARRMLPSEHWFELGLINYGMSTGTTATGFVLLRLVDPELESGAAEDYCIGGPPLFALHWWRHDHSSDATTCLGTSAARCHGDHDDNARRRLDLYWTAVELSLSQTTSKREYRC